MIQHTAGMDQQQQQWMMMQQQPQQYGAMQPAHHQYSNDEIRTLWIGDLQYWVDENYLHGCFAHTGEVGHMWLKKLCYQEKAVYSDEGNRLGCYTWPTTCRLTLNTLSKTNPLNPDAVQVAAEGCRVVKFHNQITQHDK